MSDRIKTTTTIAGDQLCAEFDALCVLLGRRRHQLASDMVFAAIEGLRGDPEMAAAVKILLDAKAGYQREQAAQEIEQLEQIWALDEGEATS